MKKSLEQYGKVSLNGKEEVQKCLSEFIGFITSEASEICKKDNRKTITGDDLIISLSQLGFDNYIDICKLYLEKYRNNNK